MTGSEISGGGASLLRPFQVSSGLQVSLEEDDQPELFTTVIAAVWRLSTVDAAVPQEAGRHVEALGAQRAAVGLLAAVGVVVVAQQFLHTVALSADVTVERFLPRVATLVNPQL